MDPQLFSQTFEGYKPVERVASGDDELLLLAERTRDGDPVWLRTARDPHDAAACARLGQRYEAERDAAKALASDGSVLSVREIIRVGNAPGLVSDVPKGRSLNDIFSDKTDPPALHESLAWFNRLMAAMESAHREGAAHGSLQGRAVYVTEDDRVIVCGLATMAGTQRQAAQLADVRSLAALMYHATSGKAPHRGFPDTGRPASPDTYVDGYPASLARFLVRRLSDDADEETVRDAGVFRRSIDALAVDPEFRRAAQVRGTQTESVVVTPAVDKGDLWRRVAATLAISGILVVVAVVATIMVMQVRVEDARRQGPAPIVQAPAAPAQVIYDATSEHARVWQCLHALADADSGSTERATQECLQLGPSLSPTVLANEAEHLLGILSSSPEATDRDKSADAGFRRLFTDGSAAVTQYLDYRLKRNLQTEALERWVDRNKNPQVVSVLRTVSAGEGPATQWAHRMLAPPNP